MGSVISVAAPPTETRNIVLAQGIQYNNDDLLDSKYPEFAMPGGILKDRLAAAGLAIVTEPSGLMVVRSVKQGVTYTLKLVNKKSEFKAALESDKTHIAVYDGHSRYGRGCCFGTDYAPGEDWEMGTTPDTGLFRMGYPYVAVHVSEIIEHGYTASLVPGSQELTPSDCEPDLQDAVTHHLVKQRTLADVDVNARSQLWIKNFPAGPTDQFWGFHWGSEGMAVVLQAGWENTASAPMDLGATDLKCKVFCHLGCSSFQHYRAVLRTLKNWQKQGDQDNFAYFTSGISYGFTVPHYLFRLFSYDKFNAGQSWEPSLDYARHKASLDIRNDCIRYSLPGRPLVPYEIW